MRTRPPGTPSGGISAVGVVSRDANAQVGPEPATVASGQLPGVLDMSILRRGNVIELSLAGALELASAPRLGEAMALARDMAATRHALPAGARDRRRAHPATIVIDTSEVRVVDSAGYQALQEALVGPNGLWDPGVSWIVGPAVARFEASIDAAPAGP